MKKIGTVIDERPNYYRGQLLLEDDFIAEQNYHISARRRHNINLHGWGIIRGFTVSREDDKTVTIAPGYAIDESGQEIFLHEAKKVILSDFSPNERLRVDILYEETPGAGGAAPQKRCDCFTAIVVVRASDGDAGLTLATIRLDEQGRLGERSIDVSQTRYVTMLTPGSVKPVNLDDRLRKGWFRSPFRPDPLVNVPEGEGEVPPPFRVGATEAVSPSPRQADEKDLGAAGTMFIPLPPSVTRISRIRIAGAENEGEIRLQLIVGGWDPERDVHVRNIILERRLRSGRYNEEFEIENGVIDREYHTLSLRLRGTRRTAVSLIAVEFVYD